MSAAAHYNHNAATARLAAENETLPQRRRQHERSAERWEEMARAAEETERRAAANDADKRARGGE